jgi:glutamate/aspartate transport system substrate-binding protein
MVETDRVAAFVMDDILLASLVANSKDPNAYLISQDALSLAEPYAIMLRRDDPQFKQLVDRATAAFFKSPDGPKLFRKWFQAPIPPKGIVLDVALDGVLKRIFENPSDSSDPKAY